MKNLFLPFILILLCLLSLKKAEAQDTLKVNFTGMTPHVGQKIYLRVVDLSDNSEVGRIQQVINSAAFSVSVAGIVSGHSYNIDFFADLNMNGQYDPPATDHAWRIVADDVLGNTTIDFAHNTTFTDVEWPYAISLSLSNMTPHLTQNLYVALVDKGNGNEVERKKIGINTANFSVVFTEVILGDSYDIDFFADHNTNGKYDAPPADHAWRLSVDNLAGDTVLPFIHNTTFTDIGWQFNLTVAFSNMTPHLTQNLYLALKDKDSGQEVERKKLVVSNAGFNVKFEGVIPGSSYELDLFADHNTNGKYDAPPADHAWRLSVDNLAGDTVVPFIHNTTFTDIGWQFNLTVAFSNMTPHLTQNLYLALKDKDSGQEVERKKLVVSNAGFDVKFEGVIPGNSYELDFFADHNTNGKYDAPPADHAWRLSVDNLPGDTVVPFIHNTIFTDILWKYLLTVHFTGFTPHFGQYFALYLKYHEDHQIIDTVVVDPVSAVDFDVKSYAIMPGIDYHVDFYADFNANGHYDAPPADHAWRIDLFNVTRDTTLNFAHNTTFTDIEIEDVTGIDPDYDSHDRLLIYPNPVVSMVKLVFNNPVPEKVNIQIYNSSGVIVLEEDRNVTDHVAEINLENQLPGLYFISVKGENLTISDKFYKK